MDIVIHNNRWYWGNTITLIRYDGMASVELQCDNKFPTVAFIKGLIVHDTCRNQGIGNEMLDTCFSEAIKLNKLFLQLNVLKDSWLVRWYERKGFTIIYEDDNEYTMWKQLDLRPQNTWKPSNEQKSLYIRFGDIPSNEKSKIYRGEEKIGEENGVSVYPAFELNGDIIIGLTLPITRTTLYTQQHLLEYENRPCYLVKGDCVGKGTDGEPLIRNISIIKQLNNYRTKKIEEQKPVGKIEPKFKVGDWITDGHATCQITFIDSRYWYSETCVLGNVIDIDKTFHLWTIQDAKDGDVLVVNDEVFIYAHRKQLYSIAVAHCFVDSAGGFYFDGEFGYTEKGNSIHPATKEQRDTLMKAMADAEYTFDFEKKELKKIEQKPIEWHREDEQNLNACLGFIPDTYLCRWLKDTIHVKYDKPAWSEEDESNRTSTLMLLRYPITIWNEVNNNTRLKAIDWLKSLRPKLQWNPSDEQLKALKEAVDKHFDIDGGAL